MRYVPEITQEVVDNAARIDMLADYGTPFVEINEGRVTNNHSLSERRINKKVPNGIYQMRPKLVSCQSRRHVIKKSDLFQVLPRIADDLFVGSTTEATMDRLKEVAESFRNGGLAGLTLLITTKTGELLVNSI